MLNIANRRLLKWTALVLALPLGVIGLEWGFSTRKAPADDGFKFNPLTHKPNGLPIKEVALAEKDEDPGAEVRERSPRGRPNPTPNPDTAPSSPAEAIGASILGSMYSDPIFVEPTDSDRLVILHRMICEYNKADEIWMNHGILVAGREATLKGVHKAEIPTAERLKEWFSGLSPHDRMALSPMFRERSRYLEVVRQSVAKQKAAGRPSFHDPIGGTEVKMFREPSDVFISPNDGLPFVIGSTKAIFPNNAREHDKSVIVREQKGIITLDQRFLENRRRILCIGLRGFVDKFYESASTD